MTKVKIKTKALWLLSEEIACFLIVVLFTYAAFSKISEYEDFQRQVGQSPLLTAFTGFVVWFIPSVEIIVSILLVMPRFRTVAFIMAFSLMVMFTTYIIAILNFTEYIPCSCGGVLSSMGWREHLIFNIVFVIISACGSYAHQRNIAHKKVAQEYVTYQGSNT